MIGFTIFSCSKTNPTIYALQTDILISNDQISIQSNNFQNICRDALISYTPTISCTNYYPFLGRSAADGFKNFISVNELDENAVVKLIDNTTVVASSLAQLISQGPAIKGGIEWVGWSDNYWYSGIAGDGCAGNNCNDYTSSSSSETISIGTNDSTFSWISRDPVCDYYDEYRFICLCN